MEISEPAKNASKSRQNPLSAFGIPKIKTLARITPPTDAQLLELLAELRGGGVGKEQATVNIDATRKGVT